MSALDSKGLEFDDVIVAFDFDRKVGNIGPDSVASLRMLRELYVAVTRAKRRVVVLLKDGSVEMENFFKILGCDFQETGAELVLREFKSVTSAGDWVEKAHDLFQSENYLIAATCFNHAKDVAWYHYALGRAYQRQGNLEEASNEYQIAIRTFGERKDYDRVIEVCLTLDGHRLTLDQASTSLLRDALQRREESLPRNQVVRLALVGNSWDRVTADDLLDPILACNFIPFRSNLKMKKKFASIANSRNLQNLEKVLPLITADFYRANANYSDSVRVFLSCRNQEREAVEVTDLSIKETKDSRGKSSQLPSVASEWMKADICTSHDKIIILVVLFKSVEQAALTKAKECLFLLGKEVVLFAVDHETGVDRRLLHSFSKTVFYPELTEFLVDMFKGDKVTVAQWYLENKDRNSALTLAKGRLEQWKDHELLTLAQLFLRLPEWFFDHVKKRSLLYPLATEVLAVSQERLDVRSKCIFVESVFIYLEHLAKVSKKADLQPPTKPDLCLLIVFFVNKLSQQKQQQNQKTNKSDESRASADQASKAILSVWPKKNVKESPTVQREQHFVFSERICKGLLSTILEAATNTSIKNRVLDTAVQFNTANKASLVLLEFSFDYRRFDHSMTITNGLMKTRNTVRARLVKIYEMWVNFLEHSLLKSPWGAPMAEEVVDSLFAIASFFNRIGDLLGALIRHQGWLEISMLTTKVLLLGDTSEIISFLETWAGLDWAATATFPEQYGQLFTHGSKALIEFLFWLCQVPPNRWIENPEMAFTTMFGPKVAGCLFQWAGKQYQERGDADDRWYDLCQSLSKLQVEICDHELAKQHLSGSQSKTHPKSTAKGRKARNAATNAPPVITASVNFQSKSPLDHIDQIPKAIVAAETLAVTNATASSGTGFRKGFLNQKQRAGAHVEIQHAQQKQQTQQQSLGGVTITTTNTTNVQQEQRNQSIPTNQNDSNNSNSNKPGNSKGRNKRKKKNKKKRK